MTDSSATDLQTKAGAAAQQSTWSVYGQVAGYGVLSLLFTLLYWRAAREMVVVWNLVDSYYTHGPLVILVSVGLVVLRVEKPTAQPGLFEQAGKLLLGVGSAMLVAGYFLDFRIAFVTSEFCVLASMFPFLLGIALYFHEKSRSVSSLAYPVIIGAMLLTLVGDFLGFRVFMELAMLPMLLGLCLLTQGNERTRRLWFPLAYLIFMIPIPASLTQSIALKLKLFATQCSVALANLFTLPMLQQGSFIHWSTSEGPDRLLVGDVCGGLRSLIALLAFGALMAYLSKTKMWGRLVVLALAGPIAVISNIFRIFLLCVVGYFFGSDIAAGKVHDVSGYLIFVVAFILFFGLEHLVRRVASRGEDPQEGAGQRPEEESA